MSSGPASGFPSGQGARPLDLRPSPEEDHLFIRLQTVTKSYPAVTTRDGSRGKSGKLLLFENLNLSIAKGEILAITGPSGAGKSSLLHLLGALDRPDAGEIHVAGTALSGLSGKAAAHFRNHEVGYVWQFHYLLPEFTAAENVAMPLLARGTGRREARTLASGWLERLGLADRCEPSRCFRCWSSCTAPKGLRLF